MAQDAKIRAAEQKAEATQRLKMLTQERLSFLMDLNQLHRGKADELLRAADNLEANGDDNHQANGVREHAKTIRGWQREIKNNKPKQIRSA